jgi:hypothetical protein
MAPVKELVRKDDDDEDFEIPCRPLLVRQNATEKAIMVSIPRAVRHAATKSTQAVVANLCGSFAFTVTKNAATTAVVTLLGSSFADWSAYIGLYDEVMLDSGHVHWCYDGTGVAATSSVIGVLAYDPSDSGVSSGFTDLINYRSNSGLRYIGTNQSNANTVSYGVSQPLGVSGSGFWTWKIRRSPGKQSVVPTSASSAGLNRWISTATSSLNFGFIKPYLTNPAATTAPVVNMIVVLKLSFRSRNG